MRSLYAPWFLAFFGALTSLSPCWFCVYLSSRCFCCRVWPVKACARNTATIDVMLLTCSASYTRTTTVTFVTCPTSTYSYETGFASMSASPTALCTSPTICPGCQGQQYTNGDGPIYQVQCNRTFSGDIIPDGPRVVSERELFSPRLRHVLPLVIALPIA